MARFRGTLKGNRNMVSRLGHEKSGLQATVNGWNAGINIVARTRNNEDVFEIYITGGSNQRIPESPLGVLSYENGTLTWHGHMRYGHMRGEWSFKVV